MIYFKACPKCRGDMHIANDMYGRYLECLQCGFEKDVPQGNGSLWADTPAKSKTKEQAA